MEDISAKRGKQMSLRVSGIVAAVVVAICLVIVLLRHLYIIGWWEDPTIINFFAAWFPFAVSILLAFIPDKEMKVNTRIAWRVSVIAFGLMYSLVLWHQQSLMQTLAERDQKQLLGEAITQSNQHSDGQIGSVRNDVKGVKSDVGGIKSDLHDTAKSLSEMFAKSTLDITTRLSKVGKPDPPERAVITFTLWPDDPSKPFPLLSKTVEPDKDGIFAVDVSFTNTSNTPANNMDIWVQVCDDCEFSEEPNGFEKPKGIDEHVRHKNIPLLNPGTSFEKTTLKIKPKKAFAGFVVVFRNSCQACGKPTDNQTLTILKGT